MVAANPSQRASENALRQVRSPRPRAASTSTQLRLFPKHLVCGKGTSHTAAVVFLGITAECSRGIGFATPHKARQPPLASTLSRRQD